MSTGATGDGSVDGMMAMVRGLFAKQVVDDPETAALRKKEETMRLEASVKESEASMVEYEVRKRKAEIELRWCF